MTVSEDFRRNVAFVGVLPGRSFDEIEEGTVVNDNAYIPKATGFIVSIEDSGYHFTYVVTAEHVIYGLYNKGYKAAVIRFNKLNGDTLQLVTKFEDWTFHPEPTAEVRTDVAVIPASLDRDINYAHVSTADFADDKLIEERKVGVGTEIAIVGLFKSHYGREKNIPIVRIGNISAMPDEPVNTAFGFIDAYLIEARSISGLSGSPVWVHSGPWEFDEEDKRLCWIGDRYNLLGLVHGHFDIAKLNEDVVEEDAGGVRTGINTGIGLVVPANRIVETLMQDRLAIERAAAVEILKERGVPSTPSNVPPTEEDKPQHK